MIPAVPPHLTRSYYLGRKERDGLLTLAPSTRKRHGARPPHSTGTAGLAGELERRLTLETLPSNRPGRPANYYTPREVKDIFKIALSTVYKKHDEFGGRMIAGCLRFPRPIIDSMLRKDGILEPK
jgi:hypothetical protein